MKNAMQLKAIMKKLAKENQISAQLVLQNYMLERFLERVSLSPYRDNYIIKGGFLISSMVGLNSRATMDMDATIKGYPVTQDAVQKMIEKISTQQKTPLRRTKSLLLRMNCVLNYSTKLQRMFFKKLRENTFILMQMMTRLRRFADVGSRISTCFLRIGVHAERFTPQNKRKEAFSMICPLYSFQCFISLFAI